MSLVLACWKVTCFTNLLVRSVELKQVESNVRVVLPIFHLNSDLKQIVGKRTGGGVAPKLQYYDVSEVQQLVAVEDRIKEVLLNGKPC